MKRFLLDVVLEDAKFVAAEVGDQPADLSFTVTGTTTSLTLKTILPCPPCWGGVEGFCSAAGGVVPDCGACAASWASSAVSSSPQTKGSIFVDFSWSSSQTS